METIQEIFNNREIAIGIWVLIAVIILLFLKPTRDFLKTAIPILFSKKFVIFYGVFISFLIAVLYGLHWLGVWNIGLLKDTIFWVLFVELPLFAKTIDKAKDSHFFHTIIKENLALVVIIEFFLNFWTFSLCAELVLVPMVVFFSLLYVIAGSEKEYIRVKKLFDFLTAIAGLSMIAYAIYNTIKAPLVFFNSETLKSILLPIILLLLNLPVVYALALYNMYEQICIRLKGKKIEALFEKVQRERAKNKRATARHKAEDDYLLTTKLFCGKCGVYMTGESGTARNGTVHRYYKCNNAKYKHTCDKKTVKKEWIEDIVVKHTHEMMIDDNVIEDIASIVFRNAKKENPAIQLLKQRLSETENALNNLLRAIEEGIITPTTKQRMIELEQMRDELNLKLLKEEMKKPTITKEGLVLWLRHIQNMSLETKEHKQRLIDIFVNAVYLYDDKLVITFNYKEASKTVTLKEVNGSIIECSGAPEKIRRLLSTDFFN